MNVKLEEPQPFRLFRSKKKIKNEINEKTNVALFVVETVDDDRSVW